MGTALLALAVVWILCELALQVSEWVRAVPGEREWRSVAAIVVGCMVGGLAAGPVSAALPPVHLPAGPAVVLGLLLAVPGLALRVWSIATLGRFFRPIVSVADDQTVVRTGPYRLVRHPSYTGLLLVVLGVTLGGGDVVAAAVTTLGVTVGLLWRIRAEEAVLRRAFGAAWDEHAAATGRLLPRMVHRSVTAPAGPS